MVYSKSIAEIMRQRFSCRRYFEKPFEDERRERLVGFLSANGSGPLGSSARFQLFTATDKDRDSLKGLGTYGVIRGATGFIVGAVRHSKKNLEDYGYLMERAILFATDIGTRHMLAGRNIHQKPLREKDIRSEYRNHTRGRINRI